MDSKTASYRGHRFPPEIISHAVWLYHRFCLSFRDVEDLLAERGITVSYETVRQWCRKFGVEYARTLAQRFLYAHAAIQNLFSVGRHLVSSANHRTLRDRSFGVWPQVTCIC